MDQVDQVDLVGLVGQVVPTEKRKEKEIFHMQWTSNNLCQPTYVEELRLLYSPALIPNLETRIPPCPQKSEIHQNRLYFDMIL